MEGFASNGQTDKRMEDKKKEFERIVREHKDTIYTVCYMFSKEKAEVDDLFQDILVNLWRGYESFRGDSKPATWIWRVSLNTCITAERKKKGRQAIPLSMDVDFYDDTATEIKQIRVLHDRIHRLGLLDRAIVLLWLEDMSYEEIGAIIGISAKNVSVKLVRIRKQLKNMSNE